MHVYIHSHHGTMSLLDRDAEIIYEECVQKYLDEVIYAGDGFEVTRCLYSAAYGEGHDRRSSRAPSRECWWEKWPPLAVPHSGLGTILIIEKIKMIHLSSLSNPH